MLVVVDVNKPSITECPELLKVCKSIVVLDHHRQGTETIENATLSYVEAYASSTCEMVSEILQYINDGVRIKGEEADCMYSGIMIDTNNFMTKTGVRTFEAAAFLRRNGADVTRVRSCSVKMRPNIRPRRMRWGRRKSIVTIMPFPYAEATGFRVLLSWGRRLPTNFLISGGSRQALF